MPNVARLELRINRIKKKRKIKSRTNKIRFLVKGASLGVNYGIILRFIVNYL